MENPTKMDDLGETHYFRKHPYKYPATFSILFLIPCIFHSNVAVGRASGCRFDWNESQGPLVMSSSQLISPFVSQLPQVFLAMLQKSRGNLRITCWTFKEQINNGDFNKNMVEWKTTSLFRMAVILELWHFRKYRQTIAVGPSSRSRRCHQPPRHPQQGMPLSFQSRHFRRSFSNGPIKRWLRSPIAWICFGDALLRVLKSLVYISITFGYGYIIGFFSSVYSLAFQKVINTNKLLVITSWTWWLNMI